MMKGGGKFEVQAGLSLVGFSTHCLVFEHLAVCISNFESKRSNLKKKHTLQILRQTEQNLDHK